MKKILTICLALFTAATLARADEGMWFLKLMKQQHLEDSLRKAGLQLPPEALYSETAPSLRECIGIFGGGCTGEVVSADGLVLTNHHCGFSYVHEMSGIGHDYMKDGYFAHNRSEELRTPDHLTFTFVVRVTDVTDSINARAAAAGADAYTAQSQAFLQPVAEEMLKAGDLKDRKGMRARIVPFFGANRFYLFYEQTYSDIRLVANPPYNIGQFGGNSDNWIWPRQNADFALFRIYADKDGQPAPYSPDNVPLRVRKYLPISLRGVNKDDYTMIMGFPGRTSRYLTSAEVGLRCQSQNAPIVLAGNPLLAYYKKLMDRSDELRLLLEDEYFSWGNSIKNFGGMNEAVEKTGLMDIKRQEEEQFRAFAAKSGKAEYSDIIERIEGLCHAYADTVYDRNLSGIALPGQDFLVNPNAIDAYIAAAAGRKKKDSAAWDEARKQLFKQCYLDLDSTRRAISLGKAQLLTPYFVKNRHLEAAPACLKNEPDLDAFFERMYANTIFADSLRLDEALRKGKFKLLVADPLYRYCRDLFDYELQTFAGMEGYIEKRVELDKIYVRGLCEMYGWTKAPDANFTLRMTYGHVDDLKPRDAVRYDWRTVLDGMFEKESTTESDYFVNEHLRRLHLARDYGRYAREDGKLPTCFLSNNDITGGNSGSGVLNANGELIGLAFDGNIESLSSDLRFNPALQRCINVDIRYVLFIIDKFGGSSYVIDELDIRE